MLECTRLLSVIRSSVPFDIENKTTQTKTNKKKAQKGTMIRQADDESVMFLFCT